MKKILSIALMTLLLVCSFTTTSFAMVQNPSSFTIEACADQSRFDQNVFIPEKSLESVKFSGDTLYVNIKYDGYGSNFVNVDGRVHNQYTESNIQKYYRFGEWVGYTSTIKISNLTPGTHNIQIGRIPNQGTTVPKKSINITIE